MPTEAKAAVGFRPKADRAHTKAMMAPRPEMTLVIMVRMVLLRSLRPILRMRKFSAVHSRYMKMRTAMAASTLPSVSE